MSLRQYFVAAGQAVLLIVCASLMWAVLDQFGFDGLSLIVIGSTLEEYAKFLAILMQKRNYRRGAYCLVFFGLLEALMIKGPVIYLTSTELTLDDFVFILCGIAFHAATAFYYFRVILSSITDAKMILYILTAIIAHVSYNFVADLNIMSVLFTQIAQLSIILLFILLGKGVKKVASIALPSN